MSAYTCITCRVAFAVAELQRAHYKTDWHRYNLKRKVAELPPVTADNFEQRAQQQAQAEEEAQPGSSQCVLCRKQFSSKNAYDNHLNSKKHKEVEARQVEKVKAEVHKLNEKNEEKGLDSESVTDKHLTKDAVNMALKQQMTPVSMATGDKGKVSKVTPSAGAIGKKAGTESAEAMSEDEESDAESDGSWDEDALGLEECLFCSHISSSLEDNVRHMTQKHGFFIPDVEYLVDLEGLITYLGEKVGVGHLCLWCNEKGRSFHSAKAVQRHMLDKGHCKMLHDGDVVFEYADFYDYRTSYPDFQEGEEEGATGGVASGASRLAASTGGVSSGALRLAVDEQEVQLEELANDGFELVLPSGSTVGHRSLQRYYRQNLPPRRYEHTKSILPRMMAHYKALGWTGATGAIVQRRVKDLGYMQRIKWHHYSKLGIKANKMQHHFRQQNPI